VGIGLAEVLRVAAHGGPYGRALFMKPEARVGLTGSGALLGGVVPPGGWSDATQAGAALAVRLARLPGALTQVGARFPSAQRQRARSRRTRQTAQGLPPRPSLPEAPYKTIKP